MRLRRHSGLTVKEMGIRLCGFNRSPIGFWRWLWFLRWEPARHSLRRRGRRAPPPAAVATSELIATRHPQFTIPFRVERSDDPAWQPVEAQLFVSTDRGAHWRLYAKAPTAKQQFTFRSGGDGEYWFAIRTADRSGRVRPETIDLAGAAGAGRYEAARAEDHGPGRRGRSGDGPLADRRAAPEARQPEDRLPPVAGRALAGGGRRAADDRRRRPFRRTAK